MTEDRDDLADYIAERAVGDPDLPDRVEGALVRRRLLRQLASARKEAHLSRTAIAARMGTSEAAVVRLEKGDSDVKLSTVQRFAEALGMTVDMRLLPRSS